MGNSGRPGGVPIARPWSVCVVERRHKLGLTQQDLATATGLTQQAISYIERGTGIPRFTTMLRVARALGMAIDAFSPEDGIEVAPQTSVSDSRRTNS